jgi:hypothetical protein
MKCRSVDELEKSQLVFYRWELPSSSSSAGMETQEMTIQGAEMTFFHPPYALGEVTSAPGVNPVKIRPLFSKGYRETYYYPAVNARSHRRGTGKQKLVLHYLEYSIDFKDIAITYVVHCRRIVPFMR